MLRKIALVSVVLCAFTASARVRATAHPAARPGAGTVTGTVSSVAGNLIAIAGGAITIDAQNAEIIIAGHSGSIAAIRPGMRLLAVIRSSNPAPQGALPASVITVMRQRDATLSGIVEQVDRAANTFRLLGRTVSVNGDTSFGSSREKTPVTFADVMANVAVHVEADVVDGRLVAREVLLIAPAPPELGRLRGVVKTIGTDVWTIEKEKSENGKKEVVTLVVNAQTKIVGSPKVGDVAEVLYRVDSAHHFVAVSIIRLERDPVPKLVSFTGKVKSIDGSRWVVTADTGDKTFTVNDHTKVGPGIVVGDRVSVIAHENADGTLTALTVVELRS